MPFIQINGQKLPIDKISFNDHELTFNITSSHDSETNIIRFGYVLQPVHEDCDPANYTLYLLYKQEFSENDIFQVYDKHINERIGWIFPIQSLMSTEHDCADNQHFLKYAFAAFQKLLLNIDNEILLSPDESDPYQLRQLYKEDCIILALANEKLPVDFNFNGYLPFLFKYGYCFKSSDKINPIILQHASKTRFNIQSISKEFSSDSFIAEVFHELIFEHHPLVKFHILYQVVEFLIERILYYELESVSSLLKQRKIYTRDLQEKTKSFLSEEKRIKKLFSDYTNEINTLELNNCCQHLLQCIGKDECAGEGIGKLLYLIRNFIVHDYRNFPRAEIEKLIHLNYNFELLIADLLITFKYPM